MERRPFGGAPPRPPGPADPRGLRSDQRVFESSSGTGFWEKEQISEICVGAQSPTGAPIVVIGAPVTLTLTSTGFARR
jgi:hypothetical protein